MEGRQESGLMKRRANEGRIAERQKNCKMEDRVEVKEDRRMD
jgi:hypothetical protein